VKTFLSNKRGNKILAPFFTTSCQLGSDWQDEADGGGQQDQVEAGGKVKKVFSK
jgi:hypothetical protein